jgi:TetR/AcrR family transcriptional regulator of autoinduction and epiphytic fitness
MLLKRLLMKREEITEKRKDTIFKAAVHCFNASGYDTTTLDTIAAQAQMSKGGIYHYFKSKKDLFLELKKNIARRIA